MNVEKLLKLKEWILAEPRRYNQENWFYTPDDEVTLNQQPPCGTVACLAGNACMMEGYKPDFKLGTLSGTTHLLGGENVREMAIEILELNDDQAKGLFDGDCLGWSVRSKDAYDRATDLTQKAQAAAMAIDDFIAGDYHNQ